MATAAPRRIGQSSWGKRLAGLPYKQAQDGTGWYSKPQPLLTLGLSMLLVGPSSTSMKEHLNGIAQSNKSLGNLSSVAIRVRGLDSMNHLGGSQTGTASYSSGSDIQQRTNTVSVVAAPNLPNASRTKLPQTPSIQTRFVPTATRSGGAATLTNNATRSRASLQAHTTKKQTMEHSVEAFALVTDWVKEFAMFSGGTGLEEFMETLLTRLNGLLNADATFLLLLDKESTKTFTHRYAIAPVGGEPEKLQFLEEKVSISLDVPSIVTHVASTGESMNLHEPLKNSRIHPMIDIYEKNAVVSELLVFPIFKFAEEERNVMGVCVMSAVVRQSPGSLLKHPLTVDSEHTANALTNGQAPPRFSETDEKLLESILIWVSTVIRNYRERRRDSLRLESITTILEDIHRLFQLSADSRELTEYLLRHLHERIPGLKSCTMYVTKEITDTLAPFECASRIVINEKDGSATVDRLDSEGVRSLLAGPDAVEMRVCLDNASVKLRNQVCLPVSDTSNHVLAVLSLQKTAPADFSEDEHYQIDIFASVAHVAIQRAKVLEKLVELRVRDHRLLALSRMAFMKTSVTEMQNDILEAVMEMSKCRACRIWSFVECSEDAEGEGYTIWGQKSVDQVEPEPPTPINVQYPQSQGTVGWVFRTGQAVFLQDIEKHPQFDDKVDLLLLNVQPHLFSPIKAEQGRVVGVLQIAGGSLDHEQQETLNFFASTLFFHLQRFAEHRNRKEEYLKNKMVAQHLLPERMLNSSELPALLLHQVPPASDASMYRLDDPIFVAMGAFQTNRTLVVENAGKMDISVMLLTRMFLDLNFIDTFQIPVDRLQRFCLVLKKTFRRHPYRTFAHAMYSAHFVYLILKTSGLLESGWLPDLELLCVFLAALCKDLAFPTLENRFHDVIDGAYAGLECNQDCLVMDAIARLFEDESTNILSNLSDKEHRLLLKFLYTAITKSDLRTCFEAIQQVTQIHESSVDYVALRTSTHAAGSRYSRLQRHKYPAAHREPPVEKKPFYASFQPTKSETDRWTFYTLFLAAADCAHKGKLWNVVFQQTKAVMADLYSQSFEERKALGLEALSGLMKDAERDIPMIEVKFVDSVVAPVLELFQLVLDRSGLELDTGAITEFLDRALDNRRRWEEQYTMGRGEEDELSIESIQGREVDVLRKAAPTTTTSSAT